MKTSKRLHGAERKLREAAVAFTRCPSPRDARDSVGLAANRLLLRRAREYAKVYAAIKDAQRFD